jgi:hypothetical protein
MYEMEGPRSALRPRPADCSANMSRVARHRCRAPVLSSGCPALRTFPGLPRSRCPSSVAPPGPRTRPRAPVARRWRTSRGCPRSVPVLGGPPPPETPPEHRFPGSPGASGVAPGWLPSLVVNAFLRPPAAAAQGFSRSIFKIFLLSTSRVPLSPAVGRLSTGVSTIWSTSGAPAGRIRTGRGSRRSGPGSPRSGPRSPRSRPGR